MKALKIFSLLVFVSFPLHFAWESWHVRFYGGYENLSPYFPLALWASIADVLYVLGIVLLISLLKREIGWITKAQWTDFAGLAVIGFFVAVFVEYKAMVFGKWYYLNSMPIIPWFEVGLSPIAQMTILLPLAVYLAGLLCSYLDKKPSMLHKRKNL